MFELLNAGGFLIWPIIICSVIAVAIIIERFITLQKSKVLPAELTEQLIRKQKHGQINEQFLVETESASPLGRVLAAGLRSPVQHRVVIKEAIEEAGHKEIHELEKNLPTLGVISSITPLLGLLGTVIGMIKVFSAITTFGVGDPQVLADGISQALVTTAAGLSVGIPTLLFHRLLRQRVNELTVEMEQQSVKFVKQLQANG